MTVFSLAKVGGLSKRRDRETVLFYPPWPPDAFEDVWHHQGQDHSLLSSFLASVRSAISSLGRKDKCSG